ncbi:alpha-amylase family glycosyl hydrolase [Microbulbifer thermotolerans]|uniref:Alpha-amylase family glycosyl hydrolase n=1 Tax=Microbulbifer thermotolerans TaxID=252514 RepID=A0AB35I249_MICTH|nr:alpha-amylase family glycosyl hydrolase [Microbulbifer thermotolerans]MCX2802743.1 alpha-amylase family glycosyl hydrolase [Microbulbifer thermotolerans]
MSGKPFSDKSGDWWRSGVIYQIYPRSFCDANGDGIGDLPGITEKLDYVQSLGVDAIWISPFFKSPMADFGYDVSDYRDVDPIFGKLDDFDRLIEAAHARGLRVIIDQILSHTSDQHPWFEESRSSRDNPKADWYVWADPKPDGSAPNNWMSNFGGSAWRWCSRRRQYYLTNFLKEQPDLNLHNPEVQEQLLSDLKFWLDRGVDGFRLDAINHAFHDQSLADNPPRPLELDEKGLPPVNTYNYQWHIHDKSQPENLVFLQRVRQLMNQYPGTVTMGEVGDDNTHKIMAEYTTGERLNMAYSFDLLTEESSAKFLRDTLEKNREVIEQGWPCWSISNHDVPRSFTRWNKGFDTEQAMARAPLFLLMQLTLRGSVCLYQGEELGLEEAELAFEDLVDPYGINLWPDFKGRDGCRTPMPWSNSGEPNAGFSAVKPWLPVPEEHCHKAVSLQEKNLQSMLNRFRALLDWHKNQSSELATAAQEIVDTQNDLLVFFRRGEMREYLVALNLGKDAETFALPSEFSSAEDITPTLFAGERNGEQLTLPPAGARVLLRKQ